MKKLLAVLLLLIFCTTASAEGLTIVATNYAMYSTACVLTDGLAEVKYEPAEGAGSLTIGDTVITADECAAVAIDGDHDVFTIPVNVMIFACTLGETLARQDPDNNLTYQSRIEALVTEYSILDEEFRAAVSADTVITCDDGSMAYFAAEYGVKVENTGIVLHTFSAPGEEDTSTPYIDLMRRNLEALTTK